MSDLNLDEIKRLAEAATPQDFDSAQLISTDDENYVDCPSCGGEGSVELHADYCNYDSAALGVQFYGIGQEHINAEAYYRAVRPDAVLELITQLQQVQAEVADLQDARKMDRLVHETEKSELIASYETMLTHSTERFKEVQAENELMKKKAITAFNCFWNGGWYEVSNNTEGE